MISVTWRYPKGCQGNGCDVETTMEFVTSQQNKADQSLSPGDKQLVWNTSIVWKMTIQLELVFHFKRNLDRNIT